MNANTSTQNYLIYSFKSFYANEINNFFFIIEFISSSFSFLPMNIIFSYYTELRMLDISNHTLGIISLVLVKLSV